MSIHKISAHFATRTESLGSLDTDAKSQNPRLSLAVRPELVGLQAASMARTLVQPQAAYESGTLNPLPPPNQMETSESGSAAVVKPAAPLERVTRDAARARMQTVTGASQATRPTIDKSSDVQRPLNKERRALTVKAKKAMLVAMAEAKLWDALRPANTLPVRTDLATEACYLLALSILDNKPGSRCHLDAAVFSRVARQLGWGTEVLKLAPLRMWFQLFPAYSESQLTELLALAQRLRQAGKPN